MGGAAAEATKTKHNAVTRFNQAGFIAILSFRELGDFTCMGFLALMLLVGN
jgi:hypothetical protein